MGPLSPGKTDDEDENAAPVVAAGRRICVGRLRAPLVFVMGKGGVGRSTVAAALALACARRGERALVVQWALGDAIGPRFGAPPVGFTEQEIAPRISTMRFSAEETLRAYFVEHLGLRLFHDLVVRNRHVRRFTRAVPGVEELLFLGNLFFLTTLARGERGWSYDRVIVDAPAMGHGISLFGVPRAAANLGLGGLLAAECARVQAMLDDPTRSAAIVVATPEELAVDETLELWPRLEAELGRAPVLAVLNRSVASLGELPSPPECEWLVRLAEPALVPIYQSLRRRQARERTLASRLQVPLVRIDDALLVEGDLLSRGALRLGPCLG